MVLVLNWLEKDYRGSSIREIKVDGEQVDIILDGFFHVKTDISYVRHALGLDNKQGV